MAPAVERPRRLMLVTPGARGSAPALAALAAEAAAAGLDWMQVREKELPGAALLEAARAVVDAAAGSAMRVLINGRPDVARLAGAAGVHLPEHGLPVADVRRAFPELALLGVSCHSVESARRAAAEGADYVVLGPVFATTGKDRPLGLDALEEAVRAAGAPVVAIGGITPANAAGVWDAGAAGVAAIRAFVAGQVGQAAGALRGRDAGPA